MGSTQVEDELVKPPEKALSVAFLVENINVLIALTGFNELFCYCGQNPSYRTPLSSLFSINCPPHLRQFCGIIP